MKIPKIKFVQPINIFSYQQWSCIFLLLYNNVFDQDSNTSSIDTLDRVFYLIVFLSISTVIDQFPGNYLFQPSAAMLQCLVEFIIDEIFQDQSQKF